MAANPESNPCRRQAIAALSRRPHVAAQSLTGLRVLNAVRLAALAEQTGEDLLPHLATRIGSVTAARQLLGFIAATVAAWPERFTTARPCCAGLTHDEWTLVQLTDAAAARSRAAFGAAIAGFVPATRVDDLFDRAVLAVAAQQQA